MSQTGMEWVYSKKLEEGNLEMTLLFVKWEPPDVNLTHALENGWGLPGDFSSVVKSCLCRNGDVVVTVGTETRPLRGAVFLFNSLVVKHNVRNPDHFIRHVQHIDPSVVHRVPRKFLINPRLLQPHRACHNLINLMLEKD